MPTPQTLQNPWSFLSMEHVQLLAAEAYRAAAYECSDPADSVTPSFFLEQLQQSFEVLVADAASVCGVLAAPAGAPGYAAAMRANVPVGWVAR
jgi:hypothetical protein